jgi:putative ABC transport system ATP-binding protein
MSVRSGRTTHPPMSVLIAENLTKTFVSGRRSLTVLEDVSLEVAAGATCAVVGPSGSGKTTLLGLCAGLDEPTSGRVSLAGRDLTGLSEDGRAALRAESVGFVFQQFRLIPTLTAVENVAVPLELRRVSGAEARAREQLDRVGLGDRLHHYPTQLSGGEQQRVALARAFVHQPRILFADEPTGNLDDETSHQIEELLFDLNRESGTALVLVTHDHELAGRTGRVLRLRGGHVDTSEPVISQQAA